MFLKHLSIASIGLLPTITVSFKVEVNVQNSSLECAFEALLMRILPFLVYYSKGLLIRTYIIKKK